MKYNTAEQWALTNQNDSLAQGLIVAPKLELFSYARKLRALGQGLELYRFSSLDLALEDGVYVAKGTVTVSSTTPFSLSRLFHDLLGRSSSGSKAKSGSVEIQLRYSPGELEQLEREGSANRKESCLMPDPYSLSQILRGAGSFLDAREDCTLVGITRKGMWVTVRYQTAAGRLAQAKHNLQDLYDYWVKMYLRRRNRTKLFLPGDPTPIVTGDGASKVPGK
jgi:hypothetical protein